MSHNQTPPPDTVLHPFTHGRLVGFLLFPSGLLAWSCEKPFYKPMKTNILENSFYFKCIFLILSLNSLYIFIFLNLPCYSNVPSMLFTAFFRRNIFPQVYSSSVRKWFYIPCYIGTHSFFIIKFNCEKEKIAKYNFWIYDCIKLN